MTKYKTATTSTYIYHTSLDCTNVNPESAEELSESELERYPYRPCSRCGFEHVPVLD